MTSATPAAPSQEPAVNLSCKSTQARLAAQWGYVPAPSQPVPDVATWLWLRFADYCRKQGMNPHHQNDLFAIVSELRAMLASTTPPVQAAAQEQVTPDPGQWCQYVAGMIFCWLQMQEGLGLSDDDEDRFVKAIAGIIQRRLWAYKPSQETVTLTEDKTSAS